MTRSRHSGAMIGGPTKLTLAEAHDMISGRVAAEPLVKGRYARAAILGVNGWFPCKNPYDRH